jgi:hypothetical protein
VSSDWAGVQGLQEALPAPFGAPEPKALVGGLPLPVLRQRLLANTRGRSRVSFHQIEIPQLTQPLAEQASIPCGLAEGHNGAISSAHNGVVGHTLAAL